MHRRLHPYTRGRIPRLSRRPARAGIGAWSVVDLHVGMAWIEVPGTDILGKDNDPVVQVAYEDADAQVKWAGLRLPTDWRFQSRLLGQVDDLRSVTTRPELFESAPPAALRSGCCKTQGCTSG